MNATIDLVADRIDARPRSEDATSVLLAVARTFAFVFFTFVALPEILLIVLLVRPERRLAVRSRWLHLWCRFACSVLGIDLTLYGKVPRSGLVVCNHLSYIDIVALSSIAPCVFVAKRDVASWPLFGWLARAAGTIFADRERKLHASAAVNVVRAAIRSGALVVLFPEGTSSDGSCVLPFKSALLEPAVQLNCPITAAAIDYSLSEGSVADEVCYWRDMTLVPHLLNLFGKRTIGAKIIVAPFTGRFADRKELARELRRQIVEMRL